MPDTALPQCPTCSGVAGSHTLACTSPEASGMYSARGNEVCDQCKVGDAVFLDVGVDLARSEARC